MTWNDLEIRMPPKHSRQGPFEPRKTFDPPNSESERTTKTSQHCKLLGRFAVAGRPGWSRSFKRHPLCQPFASWSRCCRSDESPAAGAGFKPHQTPLKADQFPDLNWNGLKERFLHLVTYAYTNPPRMVVEPQKTSSMEAPACVASHPRAGKTQAGCPFICCIFTCLYPYLFFAQSSTALLVNLPKFLDWVVQELEANKKRHFHEKTRECFDLFPSEKKHQAVIQLRCFCAEPQATRSWRYFPFKSCESGWIYNTSRIAEPFQA